MLTGPNGQVECGEGSLLLVNTRLLLHHTQVPPGQDAMSLSYAREFDLYPEASCVLEHARALSLPSLRHPHPPSRDVCEPQTRHRPCANIQHAAQALAGPVAEAAAKSHSQTPPRMEHPEDDAGVASSTSVASRVAAGEGKAAPVLDALVLQGNVISHRSVCALCRTPTALDLDPPSPLRYPDPLSANPLSGQEWMGASRPRRVDACRAARVLQRHVTAVFRNAVFRRKSLVERLLPRASLPPGRGFQGPEICGGFASCVCMCGGWGVGGGMCARAWL